MADDFSRSIARVVVAQIAEGTGFDTCQESAVDILADLLLRYLSTVCASSHSFAEQAGRSQANLADTLLSLEELGVTADDLHSHIQLQQVSTIFLSSLYASSSTVDEQQEQCGCHSAISSASHAQQTLLCEPYLLIQTVQNTA